ncbi:MAG: 50S ribosomal protein L25/general stress protein Ctc [Pseudomonadota bacterium]
MRTQFEVNAEPRNDQGKGASRRLRHAGKVPAIIYGGKGEPTSLSLNHQKMLLLVDNEKFYSSIITLNVDGKAQPAIVKDVQMHPAKNAIVHVDLQRVLEDQPIRIHLPIHFLNEATSPGVKVQGGVVSHMRTDIEILCLPKDLPEALEVDMGAMNLNDTVYLADLKLPTGVTVPELTHGHNAPVVSIHSPRVEEPEAVVETVVAAAAAPAAGAAPAADGKKDAAAPAKGAPVKKEGGKK